MKAQKTALRYASWMSAPCYLITSDDTLDKIDETRLDDVEDTVTSLVDAFMRD